MLVDWLKDNLTALSQSTPCAILTWSLATVWQQIVLIFWFSAYKVSLNSMCLDICTCNSACYESFRPLFELIYIRILGIGLQECSWFWFLRCRWNQNVLCQGNRSGWYQSFPGSFPLPLLGHSLMTSNKFEPDFSDKNKNFFGRVQMNLFSGTYAQMRQCRTLKGRAPKYECHGLNCGNIYSGYSYSWRVPEYKCRRVYRVLTQTVYTPAV